MSEDTGQIMASLEAAAKGIDAASTKLSRILKDFEGSEGTGTRYEIAVEQELLSEYESCTAPDSARRLPAADIRDAYARAAVRKKQPDLWDAYQAMSTEIKALQTWLSSQKASVSARQSILSAEKALGSFS